MSENKMGDRRAALLGDRPGSYAIARHVRMSPQKVRRVVDLVRGMSVNEALTVLQFAPQAASEPVYKVVASAAANAEHTNDLDRSNLYVSQAFVDEGTTLRRIRPRAKGSASQILKRASHITVVVEPREVPAPKALTKPATRAAAKPAATEPATSEVTEAATKAAPKAAATKAAAPKATAPKAAADKAAAPKTAKAPASETKAAEKAPAAKKTAEKKGA